MTRTEQRKVMRVYHKGRGPLPAATRFWRYTKIGAPNECWEFGNVSTGEYGRLFISRTKYVRAHRFSWELHFGSIPDGMFVLHSCDNPRCVKPDHLFLGTVGANVKDKLVKRRHKFGQAHPNTKLTDADVAIIRSIKWTPTSAKDLAARFRVSKRSIYDIKKGKSWYVSKYEQQSSS